MIKNPVKLIRRKYRAVVPIIIRMDSGFFDQKIFKLCEQLHLTNSEEIIQSYHQRAMDELTNRSFKEFHSEKLPFFRFESNMFWYFMMVLSFFIFSGFPR